MLHDIECVYKISKTAPATFSGLYKPFLSHTEASYIQNADYPLSLSVCHSTEKSTPLLKFVELISNEKQMRIKSNRMRKNSSWKYHREEMKAKRKYYAQIHNNQQRIRIIYTHSHCPKRLNELSFHFQQSLYSRKLNEATLISTLSQSLYFNFSFVSLVSLFNRNCIRILSPLFNPVKQLYACLLSMRKIGELSF